MVNHGPEYERQVAAIRKQGWIRAAIATPFAVVGFVATLAVNSAIDRHLGASLYAPACRATCEALGSSSNGFRRGGRGDRGKVGCDCPEAKEGSSRWADLSRGSAMDRALHWGGQEALMFATWLALAVPGLVIGWRVTGLTKR
jgi:hypothetical protein